MRKENRNRFFFMLNSWHEYLSNFSSKWLENPNQKNSQKFCKVQKKKLFHLLANDK